ncbi:salivary protein Tsal1-like [Cochliomyia hominivorax]
MNQTLVKLLIIFIILIDQGTSTYGQCYLPKSWLEGDWHLILKYENENLELLRELSVRNGTSLYMVCNNNDITEISCENNNFNRGFPAEDCYNPLRPQLRLENNKQLCDYNLYRVGYQIQCKNMDYFFETYKVCFDYERKSTLFTINTAYPFVKPRPSGMMFDPDEIFSMNIFACYNKRNIYAKFQQTLDVKQRFMGSNAGDERIDRGHLTPVGDYMTNTLIATTFKMINVIPQFHSINDGNWKLLEEWARNPINTPAKVCSGAFRWILKLPDSNDELKSMYLGEKIIPIPLWTYKIVLNRQGIRTVFLQYNNIHDKRIPPQIPDDTCVETTCPNINLISNNYYGYTYCCNSEHFMRNVVPNLINYC